MDIATLLGIFAAFGLIIWSIGPTQLVYFIDVPSVTIVLGGTFGAVLVNYPLKDVLSTFTVAKKTFLVKLSSPSEMIPLLVTYGSRARKEGILALQGVTADIKDPFLGKGLQLAIDGMEPQTILKILETEIEYIRERHRIGAEIMTSFGSFAPAFGMIGTLIGLVLMLQSMDDPSSIGPAMAIALITTFYGALLANCLFLPMAGKLRKRSFDEVLIKELTLEGVISIAAGDNPRIMEQKLHAFLTPQLRKSSFQ